MSDEAKRVETEPEDAFDSILASIGAELENIQQTIESDHKEFLESIGTVKKAFEDMTELEQEAYLEAQSQHDHTHDHTHVRSASRVQLRALLDDMSSAREQKDDDDDDDVAIHDDSLVAADNSFEYVGDSDVETSDDEHGDDDDVDAAAEDEQLDVVQPMAAVRSPRFNAMIAGWVRKSVQQRALRNSSSCAAEVAAESTRHSAFGLHPVGGLAGGRRSHEDEEEEEVTEGDKESQEERKKNKKEKEKRSRTCTM